MSTPIVEGVTTSKADDETHSLNGHEPVDVNSATISLSSPVTSEEVVKQIPAVTDPLTEQLERLCDQMKELPQVAPKLRDHWLDPRSIVAPQQ